MTSFLSLVDSEGEETNPTQGSPFAEQTEESLCSEIKALKDEMKQVLKRYHRQWFYQIAMRMGAQWLQHNPEGYTVMPENSDGHVRLVVNRLLPIHQTKLGKIIKSDPWIEVRADQSSYKSRKRARKGNKLAKYVYEEQAIKLKLKTLATWFIDIGTAYLYTYWDASLGEEVVEYQQHPGAVDEQRNGLDEMGNVLPYAVDEEGYILDDGGEKVIANTYKTGDVAVTVVPAFDITPYGVRNDGSYRGLIYTSAHPTETLKATYTEFATDIKPEEDDERMKYYRQIRGLVSNESYYSNEKGKEEKNTFVEELFEEPSNRYKNGRHIVKIGRKIVKNGPLPYKHKKIPIVRFIDIENSGQPFGMGTIQNLCAPQKGYNRSWSQVVENQEAHAYIKWKATKNAELEQDSLDDTCDEVILYNQNSTVEQITPAAMPSYVMQMLQNLWPQMFSDVSGQHDVTNGEAPGEVRSGYGIQQLQSSDDVRNQGTHVDFAAHLQKVGEQVFSLYEEHLQDYRGRQFHIQGTGRVLDVAPGDLEDMWRNVSVSAGTMLNADVHVNKEQILELWREGLFGDSKDPTVRRKVMEMYEFGNIDALFNEVNQDTDWAEEENDLMMAGEGKLVPYMSEKPGALILDQEGRPSTTLTLPVSEWEDHKIHVTNHDSLRKTKEYRELPQEAKLRIDAHVDWHWDKMNESAPSPTQEPPGGPGSMPPGGGAAPPPLPQAEAPLEGGGMLPPPGDIIE